eukprot:8117467-Pyramimonas_sp.AAC.2
MYPRTSRHRCRPNTTCGCHRWGNALALPRRRMAHAKSFNVPDRLGAGERGAPHRRAPRRRALGAGRSPPINPLWGTSGHRYGCQGRRGDPRSARRRSRARR